MMVPQVLSFGSGEAQPMFLEIAQLTTSRFTTKPYADQGLVRFVRTSSMLTFYVSFKSLRLGQYLHLGQAG